MNPVIFTPVWGDEYTTIFEKGCFQSFCWPENYAATKSLQWHVYCNLEEMDRLGKAMSSKFPGVKFFPYMDMGKVCPERPDLSAIETSNLRALRNTIDFCLKGGQQLLLAMPDTIFGEGTIANILKIGNQKNVCVAATHIRVLPEFLTCVDSRPHSNQELVSSLKKYGHSTWTEARAGLDPSNVFEGGIYWRPLTDNLIAVQSMLPTNYLVNFDEQDREYWFNEAEIFGSWDHYWPSKLIKDGRQRFIGSSDAAFMVEITKAHMNCPGLRPVNLEKPDDYFRGAYHNDINRGFVSIFRGE